MVSPSFGMVSPGPTPLAWKEFRRRSGISSHPKVYVYDASPQLVPHSPKPTITLSPVLVAPLGQESPRKDHSGYLVSHVTQALQVLDASTGGNIAEYIATNFHNEQGIPYEKGRKLHYMVNAILSSPKYKYLFLKDQVLKDEKRSLWRLKQPGEPEDPITPHAPPLTISLASLIPHTSLLSSLIPPTSPALSIFTPSDSDTVVPPFPDIPNFEERGGCGGGSDEGSEGDKKQQPRTTEHPHTLSYISEDSQPPHSPASSMPMSPGQSPCESPVDSSPMQPFDAPMALSARRKKRKGSGTDLSSSSSSVELGPSKQDEQDEKKRRLDVAAA